MNHVRAMMNKPAELPVWKKLTYGLLVCLFVLAALEGGLRLAGFRHPTTVERMAFRFPLDDYNAAFPVPFLQRDPVLFWKPRPNILGHNSKGFAGPEFDANKPAGVLRVVCLGDSCTHLGPEAYPLRLNNKLNAAQPGRFEVINAGVMGYSSYQGLVLLRTQVVGWKPDLITVYFGWNDHWRSHGLRDSQQVHDPGLVQKLHSALDALRLYEFLNLLVGKALRTKEAQIQNRVDLEEYGANLKEMKRIADQIGAETWFLTAPHALESGIPPFLVESGEINDPEHLIALHGAYNDKVRSVARETGATLIDLDRLLERPGKAELFWRDHIHLSDTGKALATEVLFQKFVEKGYAGADSGK